VGHQVDPQNLCREQGLTDADCGAEEHHADLGEAARNGIQQE
jgi:hypothetical protein